MCQMCPPYMPHVSWGWAGTQDASTQEAREGWELTLMVAVIAHGGRIGGNLLEILAATSARISEPNCCVSA